MINNQHKQAVDRWSNSFLRPLVPPKLLSNSEIKGTEDDGAKLIYLKFLYGIRTGKFAERPSDGGVTNVIRNISDESLWIYSLQNEAIPEGFKSLKKKDSGVIGTGDIRKCKTCRGQGRVRCKTCKGKVRWTSKDFEGNRIENVCSCGDGKQMCGSCDGYGDVEVIIRTQREFKLFDTKNSQYTGEVPEIKIKKITGDLIYEQVYDYPLDMVREMLVGGIDEQEFNSLNNAVLDHLKHNIDDQLKERGDIDTNKIHSQMDKLFASLPNPGKENKVLEHEAMPIRVMVRVENAPVKQIDYNYKEKDYSIWVYGKENSIWKQKTPSTFNYKGIILSFLFLVLIAVGTFSYFNSNGGFNSFGITNNNKQKEQVDQKVSIASLTELDNTNGKTNQPSSNQLAVISDSDGYTNLRSGKGTRYSIIKRLYSNEKFTVTPSNSKWWKVRLNNGTEGYIYHNRVDLLDQEFYIIPVQATETEAKALEEVKNLKTRGYKADHLWIPNYNSLSKTKLYSVYIGPFTTAKECLERLVTYRKNNPEAYALLVSQKNRRVEMRDENNIKITEPYHK